MNEDTEVNAEIAEALESALGDVEVFDNPELMQFWLDWIRAGEREAELKGYAY
jgi:hypothetical protein